MDRFSDVNLKQYFGIRLSTTSTTQIEALKTADTVDWKLVDIQLYEKHEENANAQLHPKQESEELLNASVIIYEACCNSQCS